MLDLLRDEIFVMHSAIPADDLDDFQEANAVYAPRNSNRKPCKEASLTNPSPPIPSKDVCPICQLPVPSVINLERHVSKCIESFPHSKASRSSAACPDGFNCTSEREEHYYSFTHALLAESRSVNMSGCALPRISEKVSCDPMIILDSPERKHKKCSKQQGSRVKTANKNVTLYDYFKLGTAVYDKDFVPVKHRPLSESGPNVPKTSSSLQSRADSRKGAVPFYKRIPGIYACFSPRTHALCLPALTSS